MRYVTKPAHKITTDWCIHEQHATCKLWEVFWCQCLCHTI